MTVLALAERATTPDAQAIESVLIGGDLSRLTAEQRVSYYNTVCQSLGLNPLTKPFAYLALNGKTVLYALKDATEQLRKIHGVSITEVSSQRLEDVFVVTAKAQDRSGRTDAATGAVAIGNLKGESLANALMKAETKAKRRATLSICGLGMLDETEADALAAREPQYTVEAPAALPQAVVPEGAHLILKVTPKRYGGDIEVVDAGGENTVYPVPDSRTVAVCEQIAQEGVPALLTLVIGARDGKAKVKAVARVHEPAGQRSEDVQHPAHETEDGQFVPIKAEDIPF